MVLTKDVKPTGGATSDLLQIFPPNGAELAAEAKALTTALLLREAADAVISGVVDPNPAVLRHRKAMLIGEAGVAHVVLRAGR